MEQTIERMDLKYGKTVITIAVGSSYFYQLAENLLKSFLLWNLHNDIHFTLVTDHPAFFEKYLLSKVQIKKINLPDKEKNFTSKFHLYQHTEFAENLFIDCDCLVYKDLSEVFTTLNSHDFTAIGTQLKQGNFFCDIEKIIKNWNLSTLPTFVGSVYFFKKSQIAAQIFDKAINLKEKYDEHGFIRLRGQENEEPLFALAMALYDENPYQGKIIVKCDAMFYQKLQSNVLTGKMDLIVGDTQAARTYQNFDTKNAYIIHFNADFSDSWQYRLEAFRLAKYRRYHAGKRIYALVFLETFPKALIKIKQILRPLFRLAYGTRRIKTSQRITHLGPH